MPDDHASNRRVLLRSWKEIAAYLHADVRTVQRWQQKTDIPIYRPGKAWAHPVAYTDELDAWLTRRPAPHSPTAQPAKARGNGSETAAPGAAVLERPAVGRTRFARPLVALAALFIIALLVVAGAIGLRPAPEPFRATFENDSVTAFDAAGRVAWRRSLHTNDPNRMPPEPRFGSANVLVADIDGSGHASVVVGRQPTAAGNDTGRIICLDYRGRQKWEFALGRARTWGDRQFSPKYSATLIRSVASGRRRYVLVASTHADWFPSQVALLDPGSGRLVEEYWHPGAIRLAIQHDVNGDRVGELLLAGVNNPGPGLGHGALVLLSVPFSRTPAKEDGGMAAFTGGREAGYVLFPRPDLCTVNGIVPFVTELSVEAGGRILAKTTCTTAVMINILDSALTPLETRLSDGFIPLHQTLRRQNVLDHDFSPTEHECLGRLALRTVAPDGNSPEFSRYWKGCE